MNQTQYHPKATKINQINAKIKADTLLSSIWLRKTVIVSISLKYFNAGIFKRPQIRGVAMLITEYQRIEKKTARMAINKILRIRFSPFNNFLLISAKEIGDKRSRKIEK